LHTFDTVSVTLMKYETQATNQKSIQAHGQEEMFTGYNQEGWNSNPGKCG